MSLLGCWHSAPAHRRRKKGGGGKRGRGRRKKSAAVSLLLASLCAGLERHRGSPLSLPNKSPNVLNICTPPPPPFPHRHTHTNPPPSWGLIRITQFMGISVWSVAEQIAGLRVIILITPCGCDYMCIWALRICVSVLRRIQRSGQYLMLPSRVCFGEAHLQVGRNIGAISKQ